MKGKRKTPYCLLCKRMAVAKYSRYKQHVDRMEKLLRDGLAATYSGHREWQMRVFKFFDSIEEVG